MSNLSFDNKIVVTGMGMVSPYGIGISPFEMALKNKQSAISDIRSSHPELSKILSVGGVLLCDYLIKEIETIECEQWVVSKFKQLSARCY